MEQSKSSKKKRRNSGHSQLKIEENTVEVLTNSKSSQTETGNNLNQPTLMGPKPANTTLVHFTELGDPPLLWQPQHSTMTGIQQIIDCFSLRKFYCLSKQPEPDDPSQVMKDLLEAVFPQAHQEEMSPVREIPNPVYQDHPNSHQQNSVVQKLCCREPVVVLRRFQQPPAARDKVGPVYQEGGSEQIERKDAGCCSLYFITNFFSAGLVLCRLCVEL
ncbi:uncharacterized protein LOC119264271 isoform X2 [Pygocentrus nattereri]|nr:uncharacterized protein LOC119264271 isoform X2 [Pygocentrus nattereri]